MVIGILTELLTRISSRKNSCFPQVAITGGDGTSSNGMRLLERSRILVKQPLLGSACIAVLLVILALGLWPFHSPRNAVTWLKDHSGILFGTYGTVMSTDAFQAGGSPDPQPCSIELWLQPANDHGGAVLTFYAPDNPFRLSVQQSLTDLMLQSGRSGSPGLALYGAVRCIVYSRP